MSWMTKEKWLQAVQEALDSINVKNESDDVVTLSRLLKTLVAIRQTEMAEENDTLIVGDGKRVKPTNPKQSDLYLAQYVRAILVEIKDDSIRQFRSLSS